MSASHGQTFEDILRKRKAQVFMISVTGGWIFLSNTRSRLLTCGGHTENLRHFFTATYLIRDLAQISESFLPQAEQVWSLCHGLNSVCCAAKSELLVENQPLGISKVLTMSTVSITRAWTDSYSYKVCLSVQKRDM